MCSQLFLFCLMIELGSEECSNLWKIMIFSIFSHLGPFPQAFRQVKEWLMLKMQKRNAQNDTSVTYSCVLNCFYFVLWATLSGRSVQSYEKWSIFSVFNRLGAFPHVFGQLKGLLMLELHKIIKVSYVVACPVVFIFYFMTGVVRDECS